MFSILKHELWLTIITSLAYCIDKELYKAIDYLREPTRTGLGACRATGKAKQTDLADKK